MLSIVKRFFLVLVVLCFFIGIFPTEVKAAQDVFSVNAFAQNSNTLIFLKSKPHPHRDNRREDERERRRRHQREVERRRRIIIYNRAVAEEQGRRDGYCDGYNGWAHGTTYRAWLYGREAIYYMNAYDYAFRQGRSDRLR